MNSNEYQEQKTADKQKVAFEEMIFIHDEGKVCDEIKYLGSQLSATFDDVFIQNVYNDVIKLFKGQFPGYRACNTEYHNIEHTISVTLATARLMHGNFIAGYRFLDKSITLGLAAALFHDVGLIQTNEDVEGAGVLQKRFSEQIDTIPPEELGCPEHSLMTPW